MCKKLILLILFIFLISNLCYALSEIMVGFEEKDLPVLNEIIRKLQYQDVYANNGKVGGWSIDPDSLHLGSGTTYISLKPATGIWMGNETFGSAPFRVTPAGALTASNATITGAISATSGSIGGFSIGSTSLTAGSGATAVGIAPATYPFYAGNATPASAPFSVTNAGVITASSGTIGGWNIGTTTLGDNIVEANSNILLDSATGQIRTGVSAATYILIDGINKKISTSDYVSGALGAGWGIDTNISEFQNIRARGKLTNAVFEKDVISSIGGNLLVSDSDVLNADMTALDASTLTVLGDTTFAVNDILRIKDGVSDEWLLVTNIASAPIYTVTRDQAGAYAANTNPIWKKGTAVVNYGASGEGLIYMTASEANSPHIDVLTHAGAPWTTTTTRMRIGNVNGFLGASSDLYGIYIGESTKYLKYDPTNGLRIAGNTLLGSLDISTAGYIASGQTAYNTGTGFWLEYNAGTPRFSIGNSASAYLVWDGSLLKCANMQSPDYVAGTTGFKLSSTTGLEVNTGSIQGAAVVAGAITGDKITAAFGAWTSKTTDTIYQAATDGFVCASGQAGVALTGYTDSSNPPTTAVITHPGEQGAITFPVKKNDYWKVTFAGGGVYWIPLGS